jgi:hypothetical protein
LVQSAHGAAERSSGVDFDRSFESFFGISIPHT